MAGKRKYQIDRDELYKLYWEDKLTQVEIASRLGTNRRSIDSYFKYLNVPVRTLSQRVQLAYDTGKLDRKGSKGSKWKGGRYVEKPGYVSVWISPSDPMYGMCRRGRGRVAEHRLVMARHLGRPLLTCEQVHHINGIKGDNRIENLQLAAISDHLSFERKCRSCLIKKQIKQLVKENAELRKMLQPLLD